MDLRIEIIKAVQAQNEGVMDRDMCEKTRVEVLRSRFEDNVLWTPETIKATVTKFNEEKGCKA